MWILSGGDRKQSQLCRSTGTCQCLRTLWTILWGKWKAHLICSHLSVITALCYLSRVLKTVISHISSVFLVVSGDRVNLVPVSSSWLQIEVVLLFYCLFFQVLILTHLLLLSFILIGEMFFCYLELLFSKLDSLSVSYFSFSPEQCLHGCYADYFNLVYA